MTPVMPEENPSMVVRTASKVENKLLAIIKRPKLSSSAATDLMVLNMRMDMFYIAMCEDTLFTLHYSL